MKICNMPDCENVVKAKGLCGKHYERKRAHGDPEHTEWSKTTEERFWEKVDKADAHWGWSGAIASGGYARMYIVETGKMYPAHRYSYELVNGVLPTNIVIDHRHSCPRSCINPEHLRPATVKENGENRTGLDKNNSSGYRGVSWSNHTRKWYVRVYHNKKCYYGGQFEDVHEAGKRAVALRNSLFTHNDLDRVLN